MHVVEQMLKLQQKFEENGIKVKAWLLGPKEHVELSEYAWKTMINVPRKVMPTMMADGGIALGLPVRLKASPGIDFEVDVDTSLQLTVKDLYNDKKEEA